MDCNDTLAAGPETGLSAGFFFTRPEWELEKEDLRAAFEFAPMRRIFRRIFAAANILGPSWAQMHSQQTTFYNEGLRAVGLWLAQRLEAARPGAMSILLEESLQEMQQL